MKYPLAEKFKAPQGEGQYTGTQMAFLRLVGCSVGQKVCTACDTDFDRMLPHLGGGLLDLQAIVEWAAAVPHVCLTGGEPLDRDVRELIWSFTTHQNKMLHIETSGTVHPKWLDRGDVHGDPAVHAVGFDRVPPADDLSAAYTWRWVSNLWITVSPKPGYLESMVMAADEVKVILGGLGDGPGWPTLEDAVRWADAGKLVYVQPRNHRNEIDGNRLQDAIDTVAQHPNLRLSLQAHKFLRTR